MYFTAVLFLIISSANYAKPANILVLLPLPFYSHTANFMPIFIQLANRGHNVTMITPFPQKKPVPNLNEIIVPNLMDSFFTQTSMDAYIMDNALKKTFILWNMGLVAVESALKTDALKSLINDNNSKFDLVIIETWFIQEPFVAFGHKFNAPVINFMPTCLFPMAAHLTGNYLPPSYLPVMHFSYNDHLTFTERLQNSFFYYWDVVMGQLYYLKKQDALMRRYFNYPGSENLPPLVEMLKNTSMTYVDHHMAVGYPTPLHKNVVYFGGINTKKDEKLPQDLQIFMDSAKEGVIYFSFGSYMSLSELQPSWRHAILSALSKVKHKVLMKLDDPALLKEYNTAGNIETRPWLPQASILAHPNCKVFITHCGLHGLMEGIHHAVPFVGLPIHADQYQKGKFIETVGIGEVIDTKTITETNLFEAINNVLTNPIYRENIQERSLLFKDNPIDIMENAIFWIEYVIRHKGAPHLRPAALDLHWYQYFMLDVIALYLLLIFVIAYIVLKITSLLFTCIMWPFNRKNAKQMSEKSKRKKE